MKVSEANPAGRGAFDVAGRRLEYRWTGPAPGDAPTIVFLHEGLGSAATWREFPDRLATATGCGALAYSRPGHGSSDPSPGSRTLRYLHEEALDVLPAVLARFGIRDPVLFGHSDGASIAIIHAGEGRHSVRAIVLEAPHVFVETVTVEGVAEMARKYETTNLRERLARHHGTGTDALFKAWSGIWLSPGFRAWNIEEFLPGVRCPLLVVQGEKDPYGTVRQVEAIVGRVRGPAASLVLPGCGHAPHAERPDEVLEAATEFVRRAVAGEAPRPNG